jgi:hypothetical protein
MKIIGIIKKLFKILILCFGCSMIFIRIYSQNENHRSMERTARLLIMNLKSRDTVAIMGMFDTSLVELSNPRKKQLVAENLSYECSQFLNLIQKHDLPNPLQFIHLKDSINYANILKIPLFEGEDSVLNLRKCDLEIIFYPDRFYRNESNFFLNFFLLKTQIKYKESGKVKIPPKLLR